MGSFKRRLFVMFLSDEGPTRVLSRIFRLGEKSVRVAERVAEGQEYSRGIRAEMQSSALKYLWFWDTTVSDLNDHKFFVFVFFFFWGGGGGGEAGLFFFGGELSLLKPPR